MINFLKIQKESAYYEMSYLEKRKKDKTFGKLIKNYNKSIRKKIIAPSKGIKGTRNASLF